ncbi:hypothetical protein DSO57_1011216 [Entomophthora muscae]|uniref:Uncharacterized protein n=1 Tax=Entomophthora muscae TaxID=34485 RepID=A0ACC2RL00_9FUNG|nr:hypothetical protein DSO57_1011216 [Entomophthora muscae]
MGQILKQYLTGNRVFCCCKCKTHLSTSDSIVSKAFQGQHGQAYLFNSVVNIDEGTPVDRNMTTGLHTVKDITCTSCGEVLGWRYVSFSSPSGLHAFVAWFFFFVVQCYFFPFG